MRIKSDVTLYAPLPPNSTLVERPPNGGFYLRMFLLLSFLRVLCVLRGESWVLCGERFFFCASFPANSSLRFQASNRSPENRLGLCNNRLFCLKKPYSSETAIFVHCGVVGPQQIA